MQAPPGPKGPLQAPPGPKGPLQAPPGPKGPVQAQAPHRRNQLGARGCHVPVVSDTVGGPAPPCTRVTEPLPQIPDEAAFAAFLATRPDLTATIRAIAMSHGQRGERIRRYTTGSVLVYDVDGAVVVKLFPPIYRVGAATEATALARVGAALGRMTPELVAVGSRDGWPYVVMTQLPGQDLSAVWADIPTTNRLRLATEMGELLRALHAVPCEDLEDLRVDWPRFLTEQSAAVAERQRSLGAPWPWVQQIPAFLSEVDLRATPRGSALLHTEIMRVHTKVRANAGRWELCGIFDFEPAMVAPVGYEFASVGLFFAGGDAGVLRELLLAYGYARSELDRGLQRRFAAMMLVHRYCNLKWFLGEMPAPDEATFDALARRWWAFDP